MNLKRNYPKPTMKRRGLRESRVDRIERNLVETMLASVLSEKNINRNLNVLFDRTSDLQRYY